MHQIKRFEMERVKSRLSHNPVVALLGPRQCGKSTTAKALLKSYSNSVYLDLEKHSDLAKLNDIWAFFNSHKNQLICLDEIQLVPEIFSQIRSRVDETNANGQFLILGSASRDLIKQSSQSLAGRISYLEMTPFCLAEVESVLPMNELWLKGGFPLSSLQKSDEESFNWRVDYIRTFLERDLPQLGFRVPAKVLNNFWTMCAHSQGQLLNSTKLGTSLGVSYHTIKNYLHILEETFMVRLLAPYHENQKKRLVKSPKVYIRDTGLVHALLSIETFDELLGHPVYGFSYESFVIENLIKAYPKHKAYFYRTAKGEELDLILVKGMEKIAFEIKVSTAPKLEKGFYTAIDDIQADEVHIIANVQESYFYDNNIQVHSLPNFLKGATY